MPNNKKHKRLECFHGSKKQDFKPSSRYVRALEEFHRRKKEFEKASSSHIKNMNYHQMMMDFLKDHEELATDPGFVRFLFASAVRDCLSVQGSTKDTLWALQLGANSRFQLIPKAEGKDSSVGSENYNLHVKFCRDIDTERGMIKFLARETKMHCQCMDEKKKKAQGMPKLALCRGCKQRVPKEQTSLCRCNIIAYCSTACQEKHWPEHKKWCTVDICQCCKQVVPMKKLKKYTFSCRNCEGPVRCCSHECQLMHADSCTNKDQTE